MMRTMTPLALGNSTGDELIASTRNLDFLGTFKGFARDFIGADSIATSTDISVQGFGRLNGNGDTFLISRKGIVDFSADNGWASSTTTAHSTTEMCWPSIAVHSTAHSTISASATTWSISTAAAAKTTTHSSHEASSSSFATVIVKSSSMTGAANGGQQIFLSFTSNLFKVGACRTVFSTASTVIRIERPVGGNASGFFALCTRNGMIGGTADKGAISLIINIVVVVVVVVVSSSFCSAQGAFKGDIARLVDKLLVQARKSWAATTTKETTRATATVLALSGLDYYY
mmetsp:Transcript_34186/g.82873  ORF Transcript_34186/g.82873 Transcript_34186/m.82873 type:complete len:287 (-) Transcript_34186:131-991(-)